MIDTHAHYDDEAFDGDREVLIESLNKNRILRVVNIGASIATSQNSIALAKKYLHIYAAVGVHPSETEELDEKKFEQLSHLADEEKVVAIGEIGLDYYWPEPSKETQKKWFECQMELAREKKLPIVIHSRDAAKDTLDMMVAKRAGEIGGALLFLWCGACQRVSQDGIFLWHWRCIHIQKCKKTQGSHCIFANGIYRAGDRCTLLVSRTQSRKEKFLTQYSLHCGRNCKN